MGVLKDKEWVEAGVIVPFETWSFDTAIEDGVDQVVGQTIEANRFGVNINGIGSKAFVVMWRDPYTLPDGALMIFFDELI